MRAIDINCDLGEGGDDASLMSLITSANIACGGHAGDEPTMRRAVALALEYRVNIGAHPGYADRDNFGRVAVQMSSTDLRTSIGRQILALRDIACAAGVTLRHVKPHGALYNTAITSEVVAGAVVDAVLEVDPALAIVTLPHGRLNDRATACGIKVFAEAFADRTYQADGTLTPRSDPRAMINREIDFVDQVLWIVRDGCVKSVDGQWMPLQAQTICVHGDGKNAVLSLRLLRQTLAAAGISAVSI